MAKITINEFAKKAYKRYVEAGMTPEGACGLMGNQYSESAGFLANRVEFLCLKRLKENGKVYTDETYTAAIDSGKISKAEFLNPLPNKVYGFGLAQWTTKERKSGLYSFTIEKGKSIADEDAQLDYVLYEMNTVFPKTYNVLKTATSVKEASDYVLVHYESPADTGTAMKNTRADYGQQYYEYFMGNKEGENNMAYEKYINSTGTHYISNSGSDENGRYTNGKAGDQTGNEWCLRSWYNRPWNCVLRHPDEKVRMKIAELACAAALNNNIGYDQNERYSFWNQLVKVNYDPSKISVKCESDCSAGVIAITRAVGYLFGISKLQNLSATYTGNMKSGFKAAGFTVLTESKYTTGTSYLLPGDILLNEASHTATNITKGNKATSSSTPTTSTPTTSKPSTSSSLNESVKWEGTVTSKLNVRTWAGSSNPTCSFSPLAKGAEIGVCDTVKASDGSDWYFIEYDGKKGFVSAKYVKKSSDTTSSSTTSNTKYSKTQFVKDIQKAIGAKVDGDAGTETFSKVPMLSTTTNRNHSAVKYLQKYLNVLGYNVGKEDCDYGDATKSGVIKFQKSKGLGADGIVGQNTWKALLK